MRFLNLLMAMMVLIGISHMAMANERGEADRWSAQKANDWYAAQVWSAGFNYAPSYAINQLEMWQAESFDDKIIDRELGYAKNIGFNMARVFLHNLLWDQDQKGFIKRINRFLEIADKNNIKIMFVLFDDVWDPMPHLGKQRSPIPHTHNSGWVQAPGKDILGDFDRHDELEGYVKGILTEFGNDPRVAVWDIYNEPGNRNVEAYGTHEIHNKEFFSLQLLKKIFGWARAVNPSQPLTAGVWRSRFGVWVGENPDDPASKLYHFMLENSDIITFHSYEGLKNVKSVVASLHALGRPLICTEYMARPYSTFEEIMPYFAAEKIGAINWGFIAGKSQTNYPWASWSQGYNAEPTPWFHDILRADGSKYSEEEVRFISNLIKQTNK
ncbi:MAG: cellulase family glycosylhydrolase [Kordiimonadaceae bacterium]|nr:cellulase family glycosylhydrolase [Kordiimonadaceae bacterium]